MTTACLCDFGVCVRACNFGVCVNCVCLCVCACENERVFYVSGCVIRADFSIALGQFYLHHSERWNLTRPSLPTVLCQLFSKPLSDNIAYAFNHDDKPSMDEITAAARAANCHDFITVRLLVSMNEFVVHTAVPNAHARVV